MSTPPYFESYNDIHECAILSMQLKVQVEIVTKKPDSVALFDNDSYFIIITHALNSIHCKLKSIMLTAVFDS